jgi:predicted transposase YdaD
MIDCDRIPTAIHHHHSQTVVQDAVRALRQVESLTDFEPLLAFFANFVLESSLIQQIMRWDMVILEQSSWYNEILNRGKQSGRQEGRQEEAVSLLLKLLNRRVGQLSGDLVQTISALSLEQLESLGEEIFDFSTPADLQQWLANSQ